MKRIITLFIAISILSSLSLASANAAEDYQRPCFGDANHDRKIDMLDVVTIQKHIAELNGLTICRTCADVDADGITLNGITMSDVVEIQKYIAQIATENLCSKETGKFSFLLPRSTDEETIKRIESAYMDYYPISEKNKEFILKESDHLCEAKYFGDFGNGILLVRCDYWGSATPAIEVDKKIGNYTYHCSSPANEKYLLIGDKYISIEDAYNEKLISDEILDSLAFTLHMVKNS